MNRLKFNNLPIPFMQCKLHIHVFITQNNNRLFMAPHLVREPSERAYNS